MPYDYVEDYEELTGKKPEPAPVDTIAQTVETKVVGTPDEPEVEPAVVAETA